MNTSDPEQDSIQSDCPPLVLVEGFLSLSSSYLWGPFLGHLDHHNEQTTLGRKRERRRIVWVSVGLVSSLHDRACELFYALKGGTVDYGVTHAQTHAHQRHGKHHKMGLYPEWSPGFPLHFLGHSMGGATIIKLIALLKQGFFGPGYTTAMVLSVTSVSSPFRGTQLVYILGESPDSPPNVAMFSIGSLLAKQIHFLAYFAPILRLPFDLHLEARKLTFMEMSFASFLRQLWKSGWAESRDATPWDATFQAAEERESVGEGICEQNIYYRSYACHTKPQLSCSLMSNFNLSRVKPSPSFLTDESVETKASSLIGLEEPLKAWKEGDGVIPLASQYHPMSCRATHCVHSTFLGTSRDEVVAKGTSPVAPGSWVVREVPGAHHLSLVPFWYGSVRQRCFWSEVGTWLTDVDQWHRAYPSGSIQDF